MVPWKNSTVVKCLLNRPSNSKSGGFLIIQIIVRKKFHILQKIFLVQKVVIVECGSPNNVVELLFVFFKISINRIYLVHLVTYDVNFDTSS